MNFNETLTARYKNMIEHLACYCYENNICDEFDDEAKALYDEIVQYETFCQLFFKFNVKESLQTC